VSGALEQLTTKSPIHCIQNEHFVMVNPENHSLSQENNNIEQNSLIIFTLLFDNRQHIIKRINDTDIPEHNIV